MSAIEVCGDLLEVDYQYIIHQCNCLTSAYGGLSKQIFSKFPYSDIYAERTYIKTISKPGEIIIRGGYEDDTGYKRLVINAFSQIIPGKPGTSSFDGITINDTKELREQLFIKVLKKIREIPDIKQIAFPYRYGCGLAGGDWDRYRKVIDKFAIQMQVRGCEVFIVNNNF